MDNSANDRRGEPIEAVEEPSMDPTEDVEGHAATIYRRRRGPYPLRNAAALPDADDRTRREGSGRVVRPTQ